MSATTSTRATERSEASRPQDLNHYSHPCAVARPAWDPHAPSAHLFDPSEIHRSLRTLRWEAACGSLRDSSASTLPLPSSPSSRRHNSERRFRRHLSPLSKEIRHDSPLPIRPRTRSNSRTVSDRLSSSQSTKSPPGRINANYRECRLLLKTLSEKSAKIAADAEYQSRYGSLLSG